MTDFRTKTALVTGGASGIGLATVRRLLDRGAAVVVLDRNAPPEDVVCDRLVAFRGDAASPSDLIAALEKVRERFGRLDLAVNAAGITGRLGPIAEQADDAMDALLRVNVVGTFLALKHEALMMRDSGGGAIVNFASVYAKGAHPNMVLYGSTKHAVVGLTEGAAAEFAGWNIRVNAVAPGPIMTPFIGTITPEIEAAVIRGIPQRRIGEPDEVAGAVLWMLSDNASYVTGATFVIDGGQAALLAG